MIIYSRKYIYIYIPNHLTPWINMSVILAREMRICYHISYYYYFSPDKSCVGNEPFPVGEKKRNHIIFAACVMSLR